jgi:hypothetical protein
MFSLGMISGTLTATVLFGVASPAYADNYAVTTQNVRVTLGPAHARHDIRQAAARGSVLFTQEMSRRNAARFRPAGWGSAHAARPRVNNRGDCATFYRRSAWRLRRSYVVPLVNTYTPHVPTNGQRWALVAVLTGREALAAVCVHMPTHAVSRRLYWAGIGRLRTLLARLSARYPRVIVGGDWNNGYPTRARFRGFVARRPPAATGPRGGRVDYLYTRRPARIARIGTIRRTFSDHNGMRIWVRNG